MVHPGVCVWKMGAGEDLTTVHTFEFVILTYCAMEQQAKTGWWWMLGDEGGSSF